MSSRVIGESVLVDRYPYDTATPLWPVTMNELKPHIQIDHNEDDILLEYGTGGYLAAATEYIESRGQISLIYQKRQIVIDELPFAESLHISRGPLVSVTDVKYLVDSEWVTADTDHWRAIGRGRRSSVYFGESLESVSLDDGPGTVLVNVVCGFGDHPDKVPAIWRLLVAEVATHFYERRTGAAGGGLDPAMEAVWDRKVTIAGGVRKYV
jgi:uncharacterized phiE125 gp8 family phage protein